MIDNTNLIKEEMNYALNTNFKDLDWEIKVATMCPHNAEKGISPISIIVARPQGINEVSYFTEDACKAENMIVKENKKIRFSDFATDGV